MAAPLSSDHAVGDAVAEDRVDGCGVIPNEGGGVITPRIALICIEDQGIPISGQQVIENDGTALISRRSVRRG
jgi:hypothetical protein